MGFDVQNFGIGLVAGWASAYGVYRARHLIGSAIRSVNQQASSAQSYATQSSDSRYINDLIWMVQRSHLLGSTINLTDIVVEPRFLTAPPLAAPAEDIVTHSVFHVVPHIPDLPLIQAPYNVHTLSIDELGTGDRALALLGPAGSGRTTALMTIILRALGRAHFKKPVDTVQQQLDAEEAALDEKKRAVRIKERVLLEQRAKERFAEERGMALDTQNEVGIPLFNRLMPVYIHLSDIQADVATYGSEIDPAEPLVRAVQRQLGRIAASTTPVNLYTRLKQGQVLLLIDGYDELTSEEHADQLDWLRALITHYRQNFFILTGAPEHHGVLTQEIGLTPVYLRPWSDTDRAQYVDNWATNWTKTAKRRIGMQPPAEELVALVKNNTRSLSPLEFTLKVWSHFSSGAEANGVDTWVNSLVSRYIPADYKDDKITEYLIKAAVLQLDEGYITRVRLSTLLDEQAPPSTTTTADDLLGDAELALADLTPAEEKPAKPDAKKAEKKVNPADKFMAVLRKSGLLVRYKGGRYRFRHPEIASYFASLSLRDVNEALLNEKIALSMWRKAITYSATQVQLDNIVSTRMSSPTDVMQSNIMEIAHWLRQAPDDVVWRDTYINYLGKVFSAPNQFPLLRERAAAALLVTNDPGVTGIFAQATKSIVAQIRQLACLSLGVIGVPEAASIVAPLLQDGGSDVQIAAALALGAIRTEEALTALVDALTEGSESLRQAVAETLADIPAEGYPTLYDAIQDAEMIVRRAAVFGIKRLKSDWAVLAIYRAFLEDSQWYVRSAAQLAFQEMRYGKGNGPHGYPPPEAITWLNEWAAKREENIEPGADASLIMIKALQEGDDLTRSLAARNIGQLGELTMVKALYNALNDKKADVRDAAYRSLADFQTQTGLPLPTPV
ncbi:MAG: HEAT repeat domain-containing protein [Chloroflexi bacterium]|nr:HEAT repeat domain-containing protein [Chloroflexota bacterium]MCC6896991.1 HEAT repeat domain-containing protein [Anaerolineae bacterium]